MSNIINTTIMPISLIDNNRGQIPGVPANPRILDEDDYEKLKKSIKTNPEMLALRELLVYPYEGRYVVIGGNMRLHVLKLNDYTDVPCKIIPENTSVKSLKAIVIKDNVNYGDWLEQALRESWKDEPLDDWGLHLNDVFEPDEQPKVEQSTTLTLKLSPDQFRFIKQRLNEIDKDDNAKAVIQILKDYEG